MAFRIYTKNGDQGFTTLAHNKQVRKDSKLIKTIGSIDSFAASIDLCCLELAPSLKEDLQNIKQKVVCLATKLCDIPVQEDKRINLQDIKDLEIAIDQLEIPIPSVFISFTTLTSCNLNEARIRCRELERNLVHFLGNKISTEDYTYINRLSDYLFCLAFKLN